jgi:hypothetical protein
VLKILCLPFFKKGVPIFDEYALGFPNEEVKYGFLNELLPTSPTIEISVAFSQSEHSIKRWTTKFFSV